MNRRLWSVRRLAGFGVLALVAGAAGAQAAGGGSPAAKPAPPRAMSPAMPAVPGRLALLPTATPYIALSPVPGAAFPIACRPRGQKPAAAPPSEALKDAFGILRRERTDDDALPARALAALEAQGLKVVDPQATRLLRADRRARAWVVPVPDIATTWTPVCRGPAARSRAAAAPREGLAVVSVGGAPAGGGGALRDLQRGLTQASVDLCAGGDRDMLGVSGIVPDGVEAVFVTAADGSATRADVHDNGYAFVLPRPRRPEPRYLVWTGTNGTPHVQPLPAFLAPGREGACLDPDELVRVTPDPWGGGCAAAIAPPVITGRQARVLRRALPLPSRIVRAPRPRSSRGGRAWPRRGAPALPVAPLEPAPLGFAPGLCAGSALPLFLPGQAPVLAAPRAVPPRPRPRRRAPRAPRAVPAPSPRAVPPPRAAPVPRAPRAAPAPSAAPAPRPAPPRGP